MPDGKTFSDYIIYVDESGDHSLTSIDENYPLFVLAFCIIKKSDYCENIVPAFQKLKFDYFGHDMAIFHGHDIRKSGGDFRILFDQKLREKFSRTSMRLLTARR